MKNRFLSLFTLGFLTFGGYIGYMTNYTEKTTANELVVPRLVDIPRNNFKLNIDFNKELISCSDNPEKKIEVNIIKKDSIVPNYRALIRNNVPPKVIVIREMRPYKGKPISCSDVLPKIQNVEKINLHRD